MARSRPNRLGMYADVRQVLDAALASEGGEYVLETHGAAVHWRQRAYKFRKLYAETYGSKNESPYDRLVLRAIPEDSTTVVIAIRTQPGQFIPAKEPLIEPNIPEADALVDFAKGLAESIDKEEDDD